MKLVRCILTVAAIACLGCQAFAQVEGKWVGTTKVEGIKGAQMSQIKSGEITLLLEKDGTYVFKQLLPDGDRRVQTGTWTYRDNKVILIATKSRGKDIPEKERKEAVYEVAEDKKSFSRDMTKSASAKVVSSDGNESKLAIQPKIILIFTRPKD